MNENGQLLEMPKQPEREERQTTPGTPKLRPINRAQLTMTTIDVEHLIDAQHPARGIWEVSTQLDLTRFEAALKTRQGEAGRSAWPPQLLVAVWLYSYSQGITSAREIERRMNYEPGLMWLTGLEVINHHTLSTFRHGHGEALGQLFIDLLAILDQAGLIKMDLVAHDGTKIRAQAGIDSFRREVTLRDRLKQLVEEDPEAEGSGQRRQAAQERAARQRQQQTQAAVDEFRKLTGKRKKDEPRVSATEPEARRMKHGDQGILPSYNAQVSTSMNGVIVGARLTQSAADAGELVSSVEEIQKNTGKLPDKIVADGGFTNRHNIEALAETEVEFYGSLASSAKLSAQAMKGNGIDPQFAPQFFIIQPGTRTGQCPAGKLLKYLRKSQKRGGTYAVYRVAQTDCAACAHRERCCPRYKNNGRTVSIREAASAAMQAFRQRMETAEGRAIYARRGALAEFPFAWLKERIGLRKFRLFGRRKAGLELLWAVLAYNAAIWMRRVWKSVPVAA